MKKTITLILTIALLLAIPSLVLAQEPAKYNFATAQGNKQIQVIPGKTGTGVIYFYNVDGNRITHVTLNIAQAPDNWDVKIDPPLHEMQVEVNAQVVTVTENLYIEPSELLSQPATDVPAGSASITVPSRGYALAKVANIIVTVPETEKIGQQAEIKVSGTAEWLGQTGTAAIKQTRDFEFSVQVISASTGTGEKIIGEGGAQPAKKSINWLPIAIGAAVVVLIIIIVLIVLTRRRRYY